MAALVQGAQALEASVGWLVGILALKGLLARGARVYSWTLFPRRKGEEGEKGKKAGLYL